MKVMFFSISTFSAGRFFCPLFALLGKCTKTSTTVNKTLMLIRLLI